MELTINIQSPELAHAIQELAGVLAMAISTEAAKASLAMQPGLSAQSALQPHQWDALPMPSPMQPPSQPEAPGYPVQGFTATQGVVPTSPQPATLYTPAPPMAASPPPSIPTSAPTYQFDDLARACSDLSQRSGLPAVHQLLNQFGVSALMQLPPERYGEFAYCLRSLGAPL